MNGTRLVYFLPVIAGIMWGSVGVFVRFLDAGGLDSGTIVCTRMLVSALIMGAFMLVTDRASLKIPLKSVPLLLLGGVVGSSYMNVVYNLAIMNLYLALASVLIGLFAIWAIFLGRIFFGERITVRKIVCVVMALAGVVLVSGAIEQADLASLSLFGVAMGFLTGLMYAVNGVATRMLTDRGLKATTINFWYFLFGAISLLPLCNWGQVGAYVAADAAPAVFWLVGQSVCCAIVPYVLFTIALGRMQIGLASTLELVEPAAGLVFGLLIFGEIPTPLMVVGVIVVIVAIAMTFRTPRPEASIEPDADT